MPSPFDYPMPPTAVGPGIRQSAGVSSGPYSPPFRPPSFDPRKQRRSPPFRPPGMNPQPLPPVPGGGPTQGGPGGIGVSPPPLGLPPGGGGAPAPPNAPPGGAPPINAGPLGLPPGGGSPAPGGSGGGGGLPAPPVVQTNAPGNGQWVDMGYGNTPKYEGGRQWFQF